MDSLREDDLKNSVLHNQHLFNHLGDLGKSVILYEKKISRHVISDCLLLSSKQGIIGIEIKTDADTTKRLRHQLYGYARTCDYVYVLCHDNKEKAVQAVIDELGYEFVGLITYEQFEGEPLLGVIHEPQHSPYTNHKNYCDLLWKSELKQVLDTATHTTHKERYYQLKDQFYTLFGNKGTHVIAQIYANGLTDPDHRLQMYQFGDTYIHDTTFKEGEYHR